MVIFILSFIKSHNSDSWGPFLVKLWSVKYKNNHFSLSVLLFKYLINNFTVERPMFANQLFNFANQFSQTFIFNFCEEYNVKFFVKSYFYKLDEKMKNLKIIFIKKKKKKSKIDICYMQYLCPNKSFNKSSVSFKRRPLISTTP